MNYKKFHDIAKETIRAVEFDEVLKIMKKRGYDYKEPGEVLRSCLLGQAEQENKYILDDLLDDLPKFLAHDLFACNGVCVCGLDEFCKKYGIEEVPLPG